MERLIDPATTKKKSGLVLVTSSKESEEKSTDMSSLKTICCLYCNKQGHGIVNCFTFKKLNPEDCWNAIKEKGACFKCLRKGHRIQKCTTRTKCEVDRCGKWHHTMLHNTNYVSKEKTSTIVAENPSGSVGYMCSGNVKVLTKMIPIILKGPNGKVQTFALLDDGSKITIIEQVMADRLGLKGP